MRIDVKPKGKIGDKVWIVWWNDSLYCWQYDEKVIEGYCIRIGRDGPELSYQFTGPFEWHEHLYSNDMDFYLSGFDAEQETYRRNKERVTDDE